MIRPKTKTPVVPVLGLLGPMKGVKPSTKIVGRRRRRPALIGLGAVGVALVVAGCGSAVSTPSTPAQTPVAPAATVNTRAAAPTKAPAPAPAPTGTPDAAATPTQKATPTAPAAPVAPAAKNPDAGIPQGNGGDADPDNNGGANDGDGQI
ncbi:MAG TPA: hypothetical protein VNX67_05170 [Solirubrobacteraceae bacterium]|nr:hypothetical protein [Solirubrobacteraceae bacterium]